MPANSRCLRKARLRSPDQPVRGTCGVVQAGRAKIRSRRFALALRIDPSAGSIRPRYARSCAGGKINLRGVAQAGRSICPCCERVDRSASDRSSGSVRGSVRPWYVRSICPWYARSRGTRGAAEPWYARSRGAVVRPINLSVVRAEPWYARSRGAVVRADEWYARSRGTRGAAEPWYAQMSGTRGAAQMRGRGSAASESR
jgi:hypothetical protein